MLNLDPSTIVRWDGHLRPKPFIWQQIILRFRETYCGMEEEQIIIDVESEKAQ